MRHLLVLAGVLGLYTGCVAKVGDPAEGDVESVSSAAHAALGDGSVLATFAAPGFPEGIAVDGQRFYVAGPANFEQTSAVVRVYHRENGNLIDTIPITHPGSDPTDALSCVAVDGRGRVYVISEALGIVRLTRHGNTWSQEVYAPLPADGLPGCTHAYQFGTASCHLLNDLAFDPAGRLFVTDSVQGTIYRIQPGGGAMVPWFTSPFLLGGPPFPIGANGIRVHPNGHEVWFTVTTSPLPELAGRGTLYKLPIVDAPAPSDLTPVHDYDPGLGPDGFAFGASGDVYTMLAFSNQVSIVDPSTGEVARLSGPNGSTVPYDAPANVAFDGKGSMLITNHALLSGVAADMATLRVSAGDRGAPLFTPQCD